MNKDSPHILCVNPWIHDYAAFDFWAKPLGLLGLAAILRDHGFRVSFLDCLDRFHPKIGSCVKVLTDGRGPYRKTEIKPPKGLETVNKRFSRYGIEPDWFRQDLLALDKPDLIFVTSLMTYWAPGVRETIQIIKEIFPDTPVILGGIYASLCKEHAIQYSMADHVVTGPGEETLETIIYDHTGFRFTANYQCRNLDTLPYPALDLVGNLPYAPILTSRGCPFSCAYCASSFLEKGLRRRSHESVLSEIKHWHHQYGATNIAFYDDALLVNAEKHILPLLEAVIRSKLPLAFHTPNALHIREITDDTADLMFKAGFKTIRLGLETTDFSPERKHDVKVKKEEFLKAVKRLTTAGFNPAQLGAYLLCGLPGQDLEEVAASIRIVKQMGIQPVLAYYTPIPHTPMWEKAVEWSRFDLEKNPLFSNNALFPCLNNHTDLKKISQLKKLTK